MRFAEVLIAFLFFFWSNAGNDLFGSDIPDVSTP